MILKHFDNLIDKANRLNCNRLLFEFDFANLDFKCLIFTQSRTLLISNVRKNSSCLFCIEDNNYFNARLSEEFYFSLKSEVFNFTNSYKITPLWETFDTYLERIDINDLVEVSNNEILHMLSTTKTNDKKYDIDGELPFFKTWKRNVKKRVSQENLYKTKKLFGNEIANLCNNNNVSSVWTAIPSVKSLFFLDLESSKKDCLSSDK